MNIEGIVLWLIVVLCTVSAVVSFMQTRAKNSESQSQTKAQHLILVLWLLACALALLLMGLMVSLLLAHRFEYSVVAQHTSRALPALYCISALWAGQEGSFLLWMTTLLLTGLVLRRTRKPAVFAVFALITVLLSAMTAASQPFARLSAVPTDGEGLSAALQDPWMAVHPPLVFIGYSAMAALAALTAGKDSIEASALRRYTRFSLIFLGLGIFTGSVWAYRALGWGGFWAWDPIENSALVPWLILCAYLHDPKPITQVKRIAPFSLACLGTFLTRSGVLKDASAHSYAGGEGIVPVLILILVVLSALCILYFAIRGFKAKAKNPSLKFTLLDPIRPKPLQSDPKQPKAGLLARPLHPAEYKNALGMRVFARITYGYAALILLLTLLPLVAGRTTPLGVYNTLTVLYALICTALLLLWEGEILVRKGFLVLIINTVLSFIIMVALNTADPVSLVLLWLLLLPLSLFAAGAFKLNVYSITHTALTLLMVGALSSSLLGMEALAVSSSSSPMLFVGGQPLVAAAVLEKEVLIVSTPLSDYIVHGTQAVQTGTELFVPYVTKPLILFFWLGGFLLLGGSAYTLLKPLFKRKNKEESPKPVL